MRVYLKRGVRHVQRYKVHRVIRVHHPDPKPPRRNLSPNPYNLYWFSVNDPQISFNGYPFSSKWWGSGMTGATTQPFWSESDYYALLGKLRERVAGSSFNAGVFLAEAAPALRMITDSATRIYRALNLVKRGRVASAARILTNSQQPRRRHVESNRPPRDLSAKWLELQYGWLPLLGDMKTGAEFLAHLTSVPFQYKVTVRKTVNGGMPDSGSSAVLHDSGYRRQSGQIVAFLTEVDVVKLSGLSDPYSIAWEMTPWSFVADWGIPISEFLESRALSQALKGTFVTTYVTRTGVRGWTHLYDPGQLRSPGFSESMVRMSRSVSTTLDVPTPTVKPVGDMLSWRRAANAVALLTQRLVR